LAYQIEISSSAEQDLQIIFEFLVESYVAFGEGTDEAIERADKRIDGLYDAMRRLELMPHQGTVNDHISEGLRNVTIDRGIFWFKVKEATETIHILAVFFGGQDHQRRIVVRLLSLAAVYQDELK